MKKRFVAFFLVMAMTCTVLSGCGNTQASSERGILPIEEPDDGVVDLVIWADADSHPMMETMIKGFESKYGSEAKFSFTLVAQGESDCKDVLLGDIKNAGDVFCFADDQLNSMIAGGMLSPVPNKDEVAAANTPESVEASGYADVLYAYPMTADNGYFMYYDKNYFTEEDVKTFDGMLAVCEANGKKMTMDLTSGWYLYSFFGQTGMEMGLNEDGVTNYCNWNESGKVSGAEVAQGILDICNHPGFLAAGDTVLVAGAKDGSVIAGISGVWNAMAFKEAWGEDYGAVKLPTYTAGGQQIQMASFTGFKMVGVNAYSEETEWAHKFADYITNEESQNLRFAERNQGPSNVKAAASEEVAKVPAILAVIDQSQYGTLQRVGNSYWGACTSFAEVLIAGNPSGKQMQELMDILVDGITQSVAQ